ncbi:MAG TPA: YHS domain-containing protein, partial [Vicinamibacteria bacterium]|nr:YHS domain-containing protein [Vicinamibacteria bacterium]
MSVRDPVCGMTVAPEKAAGTHVHAGQTFYFCSTGCRDRFARNPESYLPAPSDAPAAAAPLAPRATSGPLPSAETEFTCPMHPEIVQLGPGACPICGMALEPRTVSRDERNPELDDMERRLRACVGLTVPLLLLMVAEMASGHGSLSGFLAGPAAAWIQLALAAPVVAWGGAPFFVRGWQSVQRWHLNMFTLIALGTGAAFGYSLAATVTPGLFPASFRGHGGALAL